MADSVLIAYATGSGSTQEVAEKIAATPRERGLAVDVRPVKQVQTLDGYQAVVVGAPLYMSDCYNLIQALKRMPVNDIRDWDAIRTWAENLAVQLHGAR